jgi:hypothetical protein
VTEHLRPAQVSLANLLIVVACAAVFCGLSQVTPTNLYGTGDASLTAIVRGAMVTTAGGAIGACCNRSRRGLGIGAIAGLFFVVLSMIADSLLWHIGTTQV